jgi:hypothetical protein
MDHGRKVCPRCGEPTGSYGFCPPCRAHIDSLTGGATRAADLTTAQVLGEVMRLEEALADAARETSDRIGGGSSTAALEIDSAPEKGAGEASHPDVARLEDVLTVNPREDARSADTSDELVIDLDQTQDVARLEDVLSTPPPADNFVIAPKTAAAAPPEAEPAEPAALAVPDPTPAQNQAAFPAHVAAHVLRAAFWFEQTSAFESRPDDEVIEEPVAPISIAPPQSTPPPVSTPPPPQAEPLPAAQAEASRNWITALCLLALIALVVVLTGRRPCRCDCHKTD